MYSFIDFQFWVYAVLFFLISFVVFFIPGYIVVKRYVLLSPLTIFLLSVVLGVVFWGVQGYLFGFLQLRFLTYAYVLLAFSILFYQRYQVFNFLKRVVLEVRSLDKISGLLLLLGVILQIFPMVASGMRYFDGIRFYHVNATDGVMHLSYIQSIIRSFPPQEPGAVGLPLINYHYWSDLVIAELSRVFTLPVNHLFFQYIPLLISTITGLLLIQVIKTWKGSVLVIRYALFLFFFVGDGGYLIYLLLHHTLAFHTPAIDNGLSQFLNMPHVFAKMIFIAGLIPLHLFITSKKNSYGLLTVLFFATLVGFKVYYGLFAALGFSLVVAVFFLKALLSNFKKRKSFTVLFKTIKEQRIPLILLITFAVISSLIYFPANSGSGGLFYSPLEWPKIFLGEEALNFREWWLRQQVYVAAGNTRNVLIFNALALIIAAICIHGTRLLGLLPTKLLLKTLKLEGALFFIPGIILFTFLGFFTLQKSGLFNVFNFFIVSLIGLSFFAAFRLADITQKKSVLAKAFLILFIVISVPRTGYEIYNFVNLYSEGKYQLISNDEIVALKYLRENTKKESVVQSHPGNSIDSITPYVSYFSDRPTYFTGGGLLETHNQPTERRKKRLNAIFKEPNVTEFATSMRNTKVNYVYLRKLDEEKLPFGQEKPHLTTIFETSTVIIYRVF